MAQRNVRGKRDPIASITSAVDGLKLHYLSTGSGPAVILLHGYTQTSRMWRPIIPLIARKFTVIAPDLPGIGDSAIPKDGLDMKTAAMRIHALAKSLGIEKAKSKSAWSSVTGVLTGCSRTPPHSPPLTADRRLMEGAAPRSGPRYT
jgi:pimeloyl-ACP methyl ester carboxylesterase